MTRQLMLDGLKSKSVSIRPLDKLDAEFDRDFVANRIRTEHFDKIENTQTADLDEISRQVRCSTYNSAVSIQDLDDIVSDKLMPLSHEFERAFGFADTRLAKQQDALVQNANKDAM